MNNLFTRGFLQGRELITFLLELRMLFGDKMGWKPQST